MTDPRPNAPSRLGIAGLWQRFAAAHLHDYNDRAISHWRRLLAAGAFSLGLSLLELASLPLVELVQVLLWFALVLVAAAFPIQFARQKLSITGGEILIFLLLTLHGPAAATLAACGEGAVGSWRTTKRWSSRLATAASTAAGMLLAGTTYGFLLGHSTALGLPLAAAQLLALAAAAMVYLFAGSVPLMRMIALKSGAPLRWRDWRASSSWVGAMYLMAALIATTLWIQAQSHGRAMLAVVVLVLGLSWAWLRAHFRHQAMLEAAQEARAHQAEVEAAQNLKRFHLAFTQASIGMAIAGADRVLAQVNQALERLLGIPAAQLVGRPLESLLHEADAALLQQHVGRVLAGDEANISIELRCRTPERPEHPEIWVLLHCAPFDDPLRRQPGLIFQLHDITSRRRAEGELHYIAYHDSLTDLANRNLFHQRLELAVEATRIDRRNAFALMMLDLDRFKLVNDSLGHPAGDEVLIEVARRLGECVRPADLVARLAADEFGLLLADTRDAEAAQRLAERLHKALEKPMQINGTEIDITASIGATFSDMGYRNAEEMLRDADLAMHRAKTEGKGRLVTFDTSMRDEIGQRLQLEADLRRAVGEGQLSLVFQPLFALAPHRLIGFEALLRWVHPQRGAIHPGLFVRMAEETGCIEALTDWALDEAVRQFAAWGRTEPLTHELVVHVNISSKDLARVNLVADVGEVLRRHALPARHLLLEITETTFVAQRDLAMSTLGALGQMGVRLGIDDFGTGYSSLAYLSTLPFDCLKIDRSFVHGMERDSKNREIVRTVVSLGVSLGKQVVAEGVETREQLAMLRELGVAVGQGYLLGRPLTAPQAQALLSEPQIAP